MNSESSSAVAANQRAPAPSAAPPRKRFTLTGRTVALDPVRDAARRDLADIALADRVFAQHYVVPMSMTLRSAADLHAAPRADAAVLAAVAAGAVIDVFDLARDWAWVRADGRIGYVDAGTIAP